MLIQRSLLPFVIASTCFTPNLVALKERLATHPILGRTPDKRVLRPTRRRIPFDRVSTRPDQIEQPRELDDQAVVVVLQAHQEIPRQYDIRLGSVGCSSTPHKEAPY